MLRAVRDQFLAVVLLMALLFLFAGPEAAISAGLGGAAVVAPNAWFAFRLTVAAQANRASAVGFMVGEFIKLAATLALLAAIAVAFRELNWLALLAGLFVALKVNLLSSLLTRY